MKQAAAHNRAGCHRGSADLKEVLKMLARYPVTVDRIVEGMHYKLFLTTPSGPQLFVVTRTTSDWRSQRNRESLIRRWCSTPEKERQ